MKKDMAKLRWGYTTGTCAAGAAKAAAQGLLHGSIPDEVEIITPAGILVKLNILEKTISASGGQCSVRKDAGDDPDVTNGCLIFARVESSPGEGVVIDGGRGVGRVTRPGLKVPPGEAAINPVPRRMIRSEIEALGFKSGLKVTISVPEGEELAKKTFNPRLGIMGGISIIGTKGIVRPMSQENLKASLLCSLDVAAALGYDTVVLVPGALGEDASLRAFRLPLEQIVQMSNFLGFMLLEASRRPFQRIILAGHPGKLAKFLRGDLDTHSLKSSPAMDIIIKTLEEKGLEEEALEATKNSPTVEGILQELKKRGKLHLVEEVAERIEEKVREFLHHKVETGVVLFDINLDIVAISEGAKRWQRGLQIK